VVSSCDRSSEPSLRHLETEEFVIRERSRVKLNSRYVLCHPVLFFERRYVHRMVFPHWLNSQIDSIEGIGCGVKTRAAIELLILWSLNLAEVSPLRFRLS
jgi:hypothetical protein